MPVHLVPYLVSSGTSISIAHPNAISLVAAFLAALVLRRWAAGKDLIARLQLVHAKEERDLHGTTWLVSCSLTDSPAATLLLSNLASRGAQLVVLLPRSHFQEDSIAQTLQLLQLLRDGTSNELIFAEQCDTTDLSSVDEFIDKWQQGQGGAGLGAGPAGGRAASGISTPGMQSDTSRASSNPRRCDGIVLLPYNPLGNVANGGKALEDGLLGRFHLVNSLLPSLLLLPPERDIRIVNWITPWYAAGAQRFREESSVHRPSGNSPTAKSTATSAPSASKTSRKRQSATTKEQKTGTPPAVGSALTTSPATVSQYGKTTLTSLLLSFELQRRLILLAEADPRPRNPLPGIMEDDEGGVKITSVDDGASRARNGKRHWPNVNVVNVCPGFERDGEVFKWVWPVSASKSYATKLLLFLQRVAIILLWPVIFVLAKSPKAAVEQFMWGIVAPLNVQGGCKSLLEHIQVAEAIREGDNTKTDETVGKGSVRLDSTSWTKEPGEGETGAGPWKGIQPARLYREGHIVQLPVPVQSDEELTKLWSEWEARIESSLGRPIRRAGQSASGKGGI